MSRELLYNRTTRAWRLRAGLHDLRRQGHCTGNVLRAILGHVVCQFGPCKPLLSILWESYRFVTNHAEDDRDLGPFVDGELRACAAMLVFVLLDLSADLSVVVCETDSSLKGYSVLAVRFDHDVI